MKKIILHFSLLFIFFIHSFTGSTQTTNTQDSLALVDLYNSTNGSGWTNHTNWLTTAPLGTWYGVTLTNGRVAFLTLDNNKLIGTLPSSLGNLSALNVLDLHVNQLNGTIPASLGNCLQLWRLDLSYNQLSGSIPSSFTNTYTSRPEFLLNHNQFTFAGMEGLVKNTSVSSISHSSQADIPLIRNGNTLSVAAGGTKSNNTYKWYKDNTLVAIKVGDSTYTISSAGNYYVEVTNSIVQTLTLYSIGNVNSQDSLALVDLYNSTNGADWINHSNWLTSAPTATWYGVTVRHGIVTQLELTSNNLTGNIPTSLGNISNLKTLDLSSNKLSGNIPSSLDNHSALEYLHLHHNQLSGTIPPFENLPQLLGLRLNNNQLSGSIPASLGNLSDLSILQLNSNQLTGNIPTELGNLTNNLVFLILDHDQLTGSIPNSIGNLNVLFTFQANDNQLSGSIPTSLGKLTDLQYFELSNNQLSGSIPDSICNLTMLLTLDLNNNQLTGKIPDSIGKLTRVYSLLLDHNNLSGTIPSLSKLTTLLYLGLQNNEFTFDGMEDLPVSRNSKTYSPQATIPIHRNGSVLSVSAGGTLANNTFKLYKDGVLSATQTGDSTFTIGNVGRYYITVNNALATQLTLYSDTTTLSIVLADTTTTVTQTINGTAPTDINDGIVKLVTLTPTAGANSLNGSVTTTVTIDTAVATYNNLPYVQRHFDITPATNAENAQATITLYYTQQDFDNYNAYVTSHNLNIPLLPTNGTDNGNIRISQFHGTFTGTSNPANYDSSAVFIIPDVSWDDDNRWWAVTFPVSGFSGFYLSTGNTALPLTLLQFKGSSQNYSVNLQWVTANEIHTRQFVIERSDDGAVFTGIGSVAAQSTTGTHSYIFSDENPLLGNNYYRLKMIDQDGKFTYSPIVTIQISSAPIALSAYPNPTNATTTLIFNATTASKYVIEVADLSGKIIKHTSSTSVIGINKVVIDIHNQAGGIYLITLLDEEHGRQSLKLTKQ